MFWFQGFFYRILHHPFELEDDDFQVSGWCGNRPKCVQVAIKPEGVAIRDSKDGSKTTLTFTHDEWDAFVKGVKDGQFNSLT